MDVWRFYGFSKWNPERLRSTQRLDVPSAEIERVWTYLNPERHERIGIPTLLAHADWIQAELPELVSNFEEIDRDNNMEVSLEDLLLFFNTDDWLQAQLKSFVGLTVVKEQVLRFHNSVMLDRKRIADTAAAGFDTASHARLHMIFQGNPGTGKTSMGRVIAKLLQRIGTIPTSAMREVQRLDLVAEREDKSRAKTLAVIETAKDGVLFIDAGSLTSGGKGDFSREVIEELVNAMSCEPGEAPVQVYAGCQQVVERWMQAGLNQFITYVFEFQDYSPMELAQIFSIHVEQNGYRLEPSLSGAAGMIRLGLVIGMHAVPSVRQMLNGRLCKSLFTLAKPLVDAHDSTVLPPRTVLEADIVAACKQIDGPSEPEPQKLTGTSDIPTRLVVPAVPNLNRQPDKLTDRKKDSKADRLKVPPRASATASPSRLRRKPAAASASITPPATSGCTSTVVAMPAGWRFLLVRLHPDCSSCIVESPCPPLNPYAVVSFSGSGIAGIRQAWKSCSEKGNEQRDSSWGQTATLAVRPQEDIIQVALFDSQPVVGDQFLGNGQLALAAVPPNGVIFDLQLHKLERAIGMLRMELQWKSSAGPAGPVRAPSTDSKVEGQRREQSKGADRKKEGLRRTASADRKKEGLRRTTSADRKKDGLRPTSRASKTAGSPKAKAKRAQPRLSAARNCMLPGFG